MVNHTGTMCPWSGMMKRAYLIVYCPVILNSGNYEQPCLILDFVGKVLVNFPVKQHADFSDTFNHIREESTNSFFITCV